MLKRFFHKKSLPKTSAMQPAGKPLPRSIGLPQLTLIGVGSTLGTGIFFVMAETAPIAGPAVILSFLLAAFTAGLTALCYAEVASKLPVSGSSYTFTYITMGEGVAVLVAACLLLEWGIAGAAVSVGWSAYLNQLVELVTGQAIPAVWREPPFKKGVEGLVWGGEGYVNLPAVTVVWLCTLLLLRGSKDSAKLNALLTTIKVGILMLFVAMSFTAFHAEHFAPFMPFGVSGVSTAAAIIFFSFVGLDSVVNASEEAINPQRNIPLAITTALLIVTAVYVLVALGSLGVQPHTAFVGHQGGLARILLTATELQWSSIVLAVGAVISIFSVTLMTLFGQSRIYFAMARDGLLPHHLSDVDPKTHCPRKVTLMAGIAITPLAGFMPSHVLWATVSLGTLVVFMTVALALILLRQQQNNHAPDNHFRVPGYPLTPLASIAACLYLIANLGGTVFALFAGWMTLALLFYAFYGHRSAAEHQGNIAT